MSGIFTSSIYNIRTDDIVVVVGSVTVLHIVSVAIGRAWPPLVLLLFLWCYVISSSSRGGSSSGGAGQIIRAECYVAAHVIFVRGGGWWHSVGRTEQSFVRVITGLGAVGRGAAVDAEGVAGAGPARGGLLGGVDDAAAAVGAGPGRGRGLLLVAVAEEVRAQLGLVVVLLLTAGPVNLVRPEDVAAAATGGFQHPGQKKNRKISQSLCLIGSIVQSAFNKSKLAKPYGNFRDVFFLPMDNLETEVIGAYRV